MKPIDLVASMVIDTGQRWGDAATGHQWADMKALLDTPGGPRRHGWLRSRGSSKTFDAGAATVATMLAGNVSPGDEMYAAAAGREQAGLLARKIAQITSGTPELAGAVQVQQYRVVTPRTGAVLDVLSAELATSWGKTPRWLFVDEFCNHESGDIARQFVTALLTSLVKRRDSVCLAGSTPSAPSHWSRELWGNWLASRLWRCSVTAGPAPWQDPEELEDERTSLPDFLWRRLFLCEWAADGDALADSAALDDCTGHEGPLAPEPGVEYVVTFDLSNVKDHTSVAVLHLATRNGHPCVVVDRLDAWIPPKGGQVDLGAVDAHIRAVSRQYGGAPVVGDPWQAVKMIQGMREDGFQVKPVPFNPTVNSRRAQMLLRLVRDRELDIPSDSQLRTEFLSLRLAEGSTPGVLKLVTDGSSKGHFDRVTAVMLGAEELLSRPSSSWRDYCGKTTACAECSRVYLAVRAACLWCNAPNPDPLAPLPQAPERQEPSPYRPQPGSWASAYLPADAMRCGQGHVYSGSHGSCPRCTGQNGRGPGFTGLPPALMAVLGRR